MKFGKKKQEVKKSWWEKIVEERIGAAKSQCESSRAHLQQATAEYLYLQSPDPIMVLATEVQKRLAIHYQYTSQQEFISENIDPLLGEIISLAGRRAPNEKA